MTYSPSRLAVESLLSGQFNGLQCCQICLLCLGDLTCFRGLDVGCLIPKLLHQCGSRQALTTKAAKFLSIILLLSARGAEYHGNKHPWQRPPMKVALIPAQESSERRTNIPHTSTPAADARSLTSINWGCSMISPISCPPATSNEMT